MLYRGMSMQLQHGHEADTRVKCFSNNDQFYLSFISHGQNLKPEACKSGLSKVGEGAKKKKSQKGRVRHHIISLTIRITVNNEFYHISKSQICKSLYTYGNTILVLKRINYSTIKHLQYSISVLNGVEFSL